MIWGRFEILGTNHLHAYLSLWLVAKIKCEKKNGHDTYSTLDVSTLNILSSIQLMKRNHFNSIVFNFQVPFHGYA